MWRRTVEWGDTSVREGRYEGSCRSQRMVAGGDANDRVRWITLVVHLFWPNVSEVLSGYV